LELKLSDKITLRLEDGETVIYVDNVKFRQCKYLLLDLDVTKTRLNTVNSIDEAAGILENYLEEGISQSKYEITPEQEFWGHASNLQAWIELMYDTRILRANLSFPLLKRLAETGDDIADKVFRKEIVKRILGGYLPILNYLAEEEIYLKVLTYEDLKKIVDNFDYGILNNPDNGEQDNFVRHFLVFLTSRFNSNASLIDNYPDLDVKLKLKKVLEIFESKVKHFYVGFLSVRNNVYFIPDTKKIRFHNGDLNSICDIKGLKKFPEVEELSLSMNKFEIIECLENLDNLRYLYLSGNAIKDISPLENFKNLEELYLARNNISDISPLKNLKKLRILNLSYNRIEDISTISNLRELRKLQLDSNNIQNIDSLKNIDHLHLLSLSSNKITDLGSLSYLDELEDVDISNNDISDISVFRNLDQLSILNVENNLISDEEQLNIYYELNQFLFEGNPLKAPKNLYSSIEESRDGLSIFPSFEEDFPEEEVIEFIYQDEQGNPIEFIEDIGKSETEELRKALRKEFIEGIFTLSSENIIANDIIEKISSAYNLRSGLINENLEKLKILLGKNIKFYKITTLICVSISLSYGGLFSYNNLIEIMKDYGGTSLNAIRNLLRKYSNSLS